MRSPRNKVQMFLFLIFISVIFVVMHKLFLLLVNLALILIITILCIKLFKKSKRDKVIVCNNINFQEIDCMNGLEFEHFIANLLKRNDYKQVQVTKASGDFGVDVLAKKDNRIWAFQCKRYSSKLGVRSVQEIYSGAKKYKADIAVVVTNSYFTSSAVEMASDLSVLLWDRNVLCKLIKTSAY